jgi:hypothetical protein
MPELDFFYSLSMYRHFLDFGQTTIYGIPLISKNQHYIAWAKLFFI